MQTRIGAATGVDLTTLRPCRALHRISFALVVATAGAAAAAVPVGTVGMSARTDDQSVGTGAADAGRANANSDLFERALAAFHKAQFARAAGLFFAVLESTAGPGNIAGSTDDVPMPAPATAGAPWRDAAAVAASNKAWAQYFLAASLAALDLSHGATVYFYEAAKQGLEPDVIPAALARLQRIVASGLFDARLIYDGLLDTMDFAAVPVDLSDWLHYEQGRRDIVAGHDVWGDRHFAAITPKTALARQAQYVTAVRHVRDHNDTLAKPLFAQVASAPESDADLVRLANLATARLSFDQGEYHAAQAAYDRVRPAHLSFEEGQVLTERAWAAYYVGDMAAALGALHALTAPSYAQQFYPDSYLLRALIYKDRCHYLSAKAVVRSFRQAFARTFEQLRARAPRHTMERIRRAAVMQGPLARRTQFLRRLQAEQGNLSQALGSGPEGLVAHLDRLYATALADNDALWQQEFAGAADAVALRLLDAQEQMNLLDYEVSLAIYRPIDGLDPKRRNNRGVDDAAEADLDAVADAIFPFDGEYWNDELADYQVVLPDRCAGGHP